MNSAISVIMANYNHGHYIGEALASLVNQSRMPDEIIVVDDASTDNSVEVIEKFMKKHPQIQLLRNEVNRGALKSVALGEKMATGDLLCYQAADDKVLPGFFEIFSGLLEQYPTAGVATSPVVRHYEESGKECIHYFGKDIHEKYLLPEKIVKYDYINQFRIGGPALLFRRSAINYPACLHEDLGGWADAFMDVVIAFRHGICYHPHPLAWLRISPHTYGARERKNRIKYLRQSTTFLKKLKDPSFSDITPLMQKSGFVAGYGPGWWLALLLTPSCWFLASASFFRRLPHEIIQLLRKRHE